MTMALLGYDIKNGILTVNEKGAEIVRLIFHKYAMEQVSTTDIARLLTREGYRTHSGSTKWNSSAIIKILKNEKYVGDLVQKKTYTPDFLTHDKKLNKGEVPRVILKNHHEPIISREVWQLAQECLLRNNKHRQGNDTHSNRYIFSGKIKCGECGSSFVGRYRYRQDGTKIRRWCCGLATREGAEACCVGKLIRDDDALHMLKIAVCSLTEAFRSVIDNVTMLVTDAMRTESGDNGYDHENVDLAIERVQRKRMAVMDSYFSEDITKEDMQSMKQKYDDQLVQLEKRKAETEYRQKESKDFSSLHNSIRSEVAGILNGDIESEVFCKTILDHVTVYKDRHVELRLKCLPHIFRFVE